MREILVLSGKGGTGKTSLASSFMYYAKSCIACDYDVDASNLPILLKPSKIQDFAFSAGETAYIDSESCIDCGVCAALCRFDAITSDPSYQVVPLSCEGCGFCAQVCPVQAVTMSARSSGRWFQALSHIGQPLFFAELRPGEENSGKLVAQVKSMARKLGTDCRIPLIISDGPPGIGCAVISSLVAVDLVVLVAEPSLSGFHDLQRVSELMRLRGVKGGVIINKWDLNPSASHEIEAWAQQNSILRLGRVPFSERIAELVAKAAIPGADPDIENLLRPIWENIQQSLAS
ncbi:MAG: 4Fe-4S binding protein [Syntrophomonadaceae bacterium]